MNHLLSLKDYSPAQIQLILDTSEYMQNSNETPLKDKHILFIFEKPSLRTVLGTEVAINQLGGHVIHTQPEIMLSKGKDVEFSCRESMKDTIMNVAQWCDAIFARVYSHTTLSEMAAISPIPVVNALCEKYHPMQALADMLTIRQQFGTGNPVKLTFVGDANNVARSLFEVLLKMGYSVGFTGPEPYYWSDTDLALFNNLADTYGSSFEHSTHPEMILPGSDVVYTDTFISMGEEHLTAEKLGHFHGYQVNEKLMSIAGPQAYFMHCQPAHRGVEVTDAVLDHERSLVKKQAFNRMVSSKGVFTTLLTGKPSADDQPEHAFVINGS